MQRHALPLVLLVISIAAPAAARAEAPGVASEPLAPTEGWLASIGALTIVPPGAGKPVTIIDSGIDITHEEFRNRPYTTLMNSQTLFGVDEDHGTEVASLVGAPINHVGLVGVYPQAALRSWDTSLFGVISESAVAHGIVAAANEGPGVINMSFGGTQRDRGGIARAILYAVRKGSLVVASAGNEGLTGNALSYPASFSHVLTVLATDQAGRDHRLHEPLPVRGPRGAGLGDSGGGAGCQGSERLHHGVGHELLRADGVRRSGIRLDGTS